MKKAIILGGTHDHITLIEQLTGRGFSTILVDYLENPPAIGFADKYIRESTLDQHKVLEIAKQEAAELVITACIDQALLTMAYVCEKLGLPCHISYHTALALTNKALMKEIFLKNDIPTSKHFVLSSKHDVIPDDLKYPLVVKPADSNSSKGITKVNSKSEVGEAINTAFTFTRSHKVVVEEFVIGDELSVDVVIENFEPHIVLVTKNIKMQQNENHFTIVQNVFPGIQDPAVNEQIRLIAGKIAKAYNISNGPLLIQLIYDGTRLSVVEFSSRIGGGSKHHQIKSVTGFDILGYFIELLLGKSTAPVIRKNCNYALMNYIYAKNGTINKFIGFEELKNKGAIEDYFYYKLPGSEVTSHVSSADRLAGLLITAKSRQELIRKLQRSDNHLKLLDLNENDLMIHGVHTLI